MQAFVTLATNDVNAIAALVLGQFLKQVQTSRQLVVLVTDSVSHSLRRSVATVFHHVELVNVSDGSDPLNEPLQSHPELYEVFTKLHCWRLTQYEKAVFIDCDAVILDNIDDLFEREELSASPDSSWPDFFNSGVFVYRPNLDTYKGLVQMAVTSGCFDGTDQGLLNTYFSGWATGDLGRHLPVLYNCICQTFYTHLPSLMKFRPRLKVIRFVGPLKPWLHNFDVCSGRVVPLQAGPAAQNYSEFLQLWWDLFLTLVKPKLALDLTGLAGQLARLHVGAAVGGGISKPKLSEEERMMSWERGDIDYKGEDRFDNILDWIKETISGNKARPTTV